MSLLARLQEDMKTAMKAGEKQRLSVIRMLISDVKNIDLMPGNPSEEQAVAAYGKKLRKAVEEYEKYGQPEKAEQIRQELAIVEAYLPQKASPEETERLVDEFLAGNAFTEKQMGQAMGQFMKVHGQQVDATLANALLRNKLAGK
jgi:uncharacterized protein